MLQLEADIQQRHEKFIQEVVNKKTVYSLKSKEGYAVLGSSQYVDEDESPIPVLCFWSNEAEAKLSGKKNWPKFKPKKISLASFLENWCAGMYTEGDLAGTNFDWNLFGKESDPLDLAIELIEEIKRTNTKVQLEDYADLDGLETQIRTLLQPEE
ncbi:MAG: DUF2750 domain-containing protein [Bacteroidota bacterium]